MGVNTIDPSADKIGVWNASEGTHDEAVIAEILKLADVGGVAAGSTLGLEQGLLAAAGQPALTVRAVGFVDTITGKVEGVSLGPGNVVEVYASGAEFTAGNVLYREFMNEGEKICFTGLLTGAIITSTQGFEGYSAVLPIDGAALNSTNQGVCPLLSYGLSFKSTFFYAFRGSSGATADLGVITVVNGPLENTIKLTDGAGVTQLSQEGIALAPWESVLLYTDNSIEHILEGTNPMMACIGSEMGGELFDDAAIYNGRMWDIRPILPVTSDGIFHPRQGFVSAPYDNTVVNWYDRAGDQGTFTVSPGSPVDSDSAAGTSNAQTFHAPDGYTRMRAVGLITAHSGADASGGDAVPIYAVSSMSQTVGQPFQVVDDGSDASETSLTFFGPYEGTVWVYEYNDALSGLDPVPKYTIPLTRNGVSVATSEDQLHPAAAQLSNSTGNAGVTELVGTLNPGLIKSDVPIGVIGQSVSNSTTVPTIRSQSGTTTTAIPTWEDETMLIGITTPVQKAEITKGTDGLDYVRVISPSATSGIGSESWEVR